MKKLFTELVKYFSFIFKNKDNKRILQLLTQLLASIEGKDRIISGLCYQAIRMNDFRLINDIDYRLLSDHLTENAPSVKYYGNSGFWFAPGEVEPRVEWLKNEIKKLS